MSLNPAAPHAAAISGSTKDLREASHPVGAYEPPLQAVRDGAGWVEAAFRLRRVPHWMPRRKRPGWQWMSECIL